MQLSLPPARYSGLKVGLFYDQLLHRVEALPGVQAAGVCRVLPLTGNDASLNFQIEAQPRVSSADQPRAKFRTASGGYFAALGIPLLRGRFFDNRDNQQTPKVVIINEMAARRYWPGENPIGKRILSGFDDSQWSTIIGVVGDVKYAGLDAAASPETYYHYLQIPARGNEFHRGYRGAGHSDQHRSGCDDIVGSAGVAGARSQPAGLQRAFHAELCCKARCRSRGFAHF